MHWSRHRARIVVWSFLAAAFALSVFVLAAKAASTRSLRIRTTITEIGRGNYYAWGQMWMWAERLTPDERRGLAQACAQYAHTNQFVHPIDNSWPPPETPSWLQSASDWTRHLFELDDANLAYDTIEFRVPPDVSVRKFESMFRFHARNPAVKPATPAVSVVSPSPVPAQ